MRKYYLDNIRWITVVIVVLYHVIYMYNAEGIPGVCGKITDLEVQYFDVFQYIVYPWFMMLLFMVSGISSWLYLDNHSHREFISSRTTKLLVPSTIGLFAFQFLQGYVNVSLGDAVLKDPGIPLIAKVLICIVSGVGVLWKRSRSALVHSAAVAVFYAACACAENRQRQALECLWKGQDPGARRTRSPNLWSCTDL